MSCAGHTNAYEALRFNRQFIIGPASPRGFDDWNQTDCGTGLRISSHPNLHRAHCEISGTTILCLGDVYDAEEPTRGNHAIVQALAAQSRSFSDFERRAATLSGRWVMVVRIGDASRLYPDAVGSRPVFYTNGHDGVWVAAQPFLLAKSLALPLDRARTKAFLGSPRGSSWPGLVTPVERVVQLWPNHFLDLQTGAAHRFWPSSAIIRTSAEASAACAVEWLSNIIRAGALRAPLNLWLTGGYDSRVLFAVSRALHAQMSFSVFDNHRNPSFDRTIARALVRKSERPIRRVTLKRASAQFWDLLRTNTAGMALDLGNVTKTAFEDFPQSTLHVTGSVAEVGRCFYYKNGARPPRVDAQTLCRLAGFDGNPIALDVFATWLSEARQTIPPDFGIDLLDLFYWEHRLGTWLGVQGLANDTFINTLVPFNCRAVLTALLGVDLGYRRSPYRLFRMMCDMTFPEVLDVPFNWSLRWQIGELFRSALPWRVRNWVGQLKDTRVGLTP